MIAVMVLATVGTLVTYVRARRGFRYGSPSGWHRAALLALGILAAGVTLNMGFMKSNSRVPYTIYGDGSYRVQSENPIGPGALRPENPKEP
jgi:cytochrome d ubiquinol oxidase subunit I